MTKVAVIGARSFLARHFANEAKARGWTIVAIDRPEADVCDAGQIQRALEAAKADAVVNFAAIAFVASADERVMYEVNAFGQANVLKSLQAIGFTGRHVFVSSANIYGATAAVSKETDMPRPANHYGASKVLAEAFCGFLGGGFPISMVRPFNCIGVGQPVHYLAPKIVDAFRRRLPELSMGNLAVERDFVDARDFAQMLALVVESGEAGGIYNFCNNMTTPIPELIERASRISGHKLVVNSDAGLHRANDISRQIGDNSRIRALGYQRRHTIDDTIAWMLSADQIQR